MACLPSLIGMRGRCAVVEEQDCWLLVVTRCVAGRVALTRQAVVVGLLPRRLDRRTYEPSYHVLRRLDHGEPFAGLSRLGQILLFLWSFCLIVVLLGVGARDFRAALSCILRILSDREQTSRALAGARSYAWQPSAAATSAVLGVLSPTVLTDAVWLQGQARRR